MLGRDKDRLLAESRHVGFRPKAVMQFRQILEQDVIDMGKSKGNTTR